MSDQFANPGAAGASIDYKELNGRLLLIDCLAQEHGIVTVHGPRDPVRATVTVLDGPKAGEVTEDTLIFPAVLNGQLRSRIGKKVLGRLGQGVAKPGQDPPWQLVDATPAEITTAEAWVAKGLTPTVTSAAAPF